MNWYRFAEEASRYEVRNAMIFEGIKKVVVIGMGGSGIVGDMVATIMQDLDKISIHVYKDFYVPKSFIDENTFVLSISYSGNTLETITATLQALKLGAKIGIVASGGELIDIASKARLPHIIIRQGLAPRAALPLMLVASLKLLSMCGVAKVPLSVIEEAIAVLRDVNKASQIALQLASFLNGSTMPLIIATTRYAPLAVRFKNELNENSKMPAKVEIAPELFHNDIVGWERQRINGKAIVIGSDIDYENMLLDLYSDYLRSVGFDVFYLDLEGNILQRYLYGSLIIGLTSVELAQRSGIDPLQTKSISMYKEFLKKNRERIERAVLEHGFKIQ